MDHQHLEAMAREIEEEEGELPPTLELVAVAVYRLGLAILGGSVLYGAGYITSVALHWLRLHFTPAP